MPEELQPPDHKNAAPDASTAFEDSWPSNYVDINRASYEALASEYHGRKSADLEKDLKLIDPFVRLLRERFNGQQIRVLDLGCGAGLNLAMFADAGFVATGLDVSARMLDAAKETCPSAALLEGDFLKIGLPENGFHGVFAKAIIHLFPKPDALHVLAKIKSILLPKGVFYVTTTVEQQRQSGLRAKVDYQGAYARYRRTWTEEELLSSVVSQGFTVLETNHNSELARGKKWFNVWGEKRAL